MKKFVLAATVALAILVGSFGLAGTSHALNGGPWTWVNAATSRCLDSNGTGAVYTLACNGGGFQLWFNSQNQFGDQIRNYQTGQCLDTNGTSVYMLACNGGNFQRWVVSLSGSGWEIKNVSTLVCLDSNPTGSVYAIACNGGSYQRWI